jgi:glucose/arabinose dehydrogenase
MRAMTSSIRWLALAALSVAALLASCAAANAPASAPTAAPKATTLPAGYPRPLRDDIQIKRVAEVGAGMMRLVRDPGSSDLYYLTPQGDVYFITTQPRVSPTGTLAYSYAEIGGTDYVMGMAFGPDRALYIIGNESKDKQNRCVIRKGTSTENGRRWTTLVTTEFHPKSETNFDHLCNGLAVSPDGRWVYFNSGSRTDHGEVQTAEGKWKDVREVPLTSAVFRVPADSKDLVLPNDEVKLKQGGYLFADGVRNAFDLAFNSAGDLIGVENGPDAHLPDELNWLREGKHYGFPWRFGDVDNPQQFADYDPDQDARISDDFVAVQRGTYANDPGFPKPPMAFTDPIANFGPAADQFLDADGELKDASELGQPLYGVTAHRSPLGLTFDLDNALGGDYKGAGFLLSWGAAGGPQTDKGQDLLLLRLTKKGDAYQMTAEQIVTGFDRPMDSALIGNRLYVLDNGGRGAIWELTLPD